MMIAKDESNRRVAPSALLITTFTLLTGWYSLKCFPAYPRSWLSTFVMKSRGKKKRGGAVYPAGNLFVTTLPIARWAAPVLLSEGWAPCAETGRRYRAIRPEARASE